MAVLSLCAQTDRELVRRGNAYFGKKDYAQAEVCFKKALFANGKNAIAAYNLGCALQAQKKDSAAIEQYTKAAKGEENKMRRASAYHNMGTILQAQKDYGKAIEAYKNALRCNPKHANARYNLTMCMKQNKNQQQQQQQQSNSNNKDKQKKKEQNKPQQNKKNKQKPQQPKEDNMSKDNAEQLLNAAMQEEKATQQRLKKYMKQPLSKTNVKNW